MTPIGAYVTFLGSRSSKVKFPKILKMKSSSVWDLGNDYVTCLRDFSRSRSFKVKVQKMFEIIKNTQKTLQATLCVRV